MPKDKNNFNFGVLYIAFNYRAFSVYLALLLDKTRFIIFNSTSAILWFNKGIIKLSL